MTIYTVSYCDELIEIDADLAQASASIHWRETAKDRYKRWRLDQRWESTPFQTADFCHDPQAMAAGVIEYLYPQDVVDIDDIEIEEEEEETEEEESEE